MKIKKFFKEEYLNYASYENLRSIPSYIDGNYNVKRKIIYTLLSKPNFKMRVDLFSNEVISKSKYIHGSLDDAVVNMVQDHVGSNNLPLFKGYGDFGSRLTGGESSATRYIQLSPVMANYIFNKDDNNILINQRFEGYDIEPKFYVPIIPMLLINGSQSPSIGFSHKVLPRNILDITNNIKRKLNNKEYTEMLPYWNGFKGVVEKGEGERQFILKGVVEIINSTTVRITELPLGYNMLSYRKILLDLKQNKKIVDFTVNNDTKKDIFDYTIKFERKILNDLSEEKLIDYLNLKKTVSDILFLNNEKNKIEEFNNVYEILDKYIQIRLEYYSKRKEFLINKMTDDITILLNKIRFIKDIIEEKITFKNKSKKDIESDLSKYNYDLIEDSFDYLLNLNIYNLTKDKLEDYINKERELQKKLEDYIKKDIKDIWIEEINELLKALGYSSKDLKESKKVVMISTPLGNNKLYDEFNNTVHSNVEGITEVNIDRRKRALELMENLEAKKIDKKKLF